MTFSRLDALSVSASLFLSLSLSLSLASSVVTTLVLHFLSAPPLPSTTAAPTSSSLPSVRCSESRTLARAATRVSLGAIDLRPGRSRRAQSFSLLHASRLTSHANQTKPNQTEPNQNRNRNQNRQQGPAPAQPHPDPRQGGHPRGRRVPDRDPRQAHRLQARRQQADQGPSRPRRAGPGGDEARHFP